MVVSSDEDTTVEDTGTGNGTFFNSAYNYGGALNWHMLEGFKFPGGMQLDIGWNLWVNGMGAYGDKKSDGNFIPKPVRPFRFMKVSFLPKEVRYAFQMQFGVFRMMEAAPNMVLPADRVTTSAEIRESFNIGFNLKKKKVEYIFLDDKHSKWKIST